MMTSDGPETKKMTSDDKLKQMPVSVRLKLLSDIGFRPKYGQESFHAVPIVIDCSLMYEGSSWLTLFQTFIVQKSRPSQYDN